MTQVVTLTVGKLGTVKNLETNGFTGSACTAATQAFTESVAGGNATAVETVTKPEFDQIPAEEEAVYANGAAGY